MQKYDLFIASSRLIIGKRPMLSKDLEQAIAQCHTLARQARHEFMTVESLLLCLLDEPSAKAVLKVCGANLERLRADLQRAILSIPHLGQDDARDTQPTLGFQRVVKKIRPPFIY